MNMEQNIFEHYIDAIEARPLWGWERQDEGNDPEEELWVVQAQENHGRSAMVRRIPGGYRASLCIEMQQAPQQHENPIMMELAFAHESTKFTTASAAMVWVEQHAWHTAAQVLKVYTESTVLPILSIKQQETCREIVWHGASMSIGRHHTNDIVINHPLGSRYHGRIERRGNEFLLHDLESTNGTYVNGTRIRGSHVLHDHDQIMIADTVITFLLPSHDSTRC